MTFITSILDSVTHFGKTIIHIDTELNNVEPGSDAELKLLLESSFCHAFVQLQKGESLADEAIALAEKRQDKTKLAQALCCKAFNQFRIGYTTAALTAAAKALSYFESLDDTGGIADAHWLMGTMMEVMGSGEEPDHHKKALSAYQQIGDSTGVYLATVQQNSIPLLQFQLTEVFQAQEKLFGELTSSWQRHLRCYCFGEMIKPLFMKHDIPALKTGLEQWKDMANENGNFHDYTQAKSILTECYRLQNLDEAVMQACLESIECCEKLGSIHGQITMLLIMANICYQQSQYGDAANYYGKADEISVKIGAPYKHLYALNGAGLALLKSGDFKTAKEKFETVLCEAKEIHDQLNLIEAHRNLADLALEQNDFNHAFRSFKNLFDIAGNQGIKIQDYGKYAQVLDKATDEALQEAGIKPAERNILQLQNLNQYLELAQQQQSKQEEANAYSALADYHEEAEDLKQALGYRKLYTSSYEEMMNEQNINTIGKLRMQYESEVKDKEIALLKKENEQALLTERLRISRDLHDDMGTALGSIGMYSDIAINNLKKKHPDLLQELLEKIGKASRLTIDRMSDLVWSIDPGHDNFDDMLDRMKAFAVMMLSVREIGFAFETKGDFTGMVLPMQKRKNIFLIFKEAIYNITKYSECSMVSVTFTHHHEGLQLILEDNGKGFNANEVNSYNGNGLKNMKARTTEMNGEFSIESEPGKGTNLTLKMKL